MPAHDHLSQHGCKPGDGIEAVPCHSRITHICCALRAYLLACNVLSWRLCGQVTKVGRGQKLGDNAEAVPFSDMTVEDLLRIVRSLPPEDSAVAAVSRGLFYLDSRALAALLKELHKVGLSNRCMLQPAGRDLTPNNLCSSGVAASIGS